MRRCSTKLRAPARVESLETRSLLAGDIMISEIMYHPATKNSDHEFIELFNPSESNVDLSGWRISNGVDFSLPDISIPANMRLVIAADVDAFNTIYSGVPLVVGGWAGRLANRGEVIEIVDDVGQMVDRVRYADQGEWAQRGLDEPDNGFQGWTWKALHDGGGRSLELINSELPNHLGPNWSASAVDGGTPGKPNSITAADVAPIITNVRHSPAIPTSTQPVTILAEIADETDDVSVTLQFRQNSAAYMPVTMNRVTGMDIESGTSTYSATIHAVPNDTIVEFFVESTDSNGNRRISPSVDSHPGRSANFLYQVIDDAPTSASWEPTDQPVTYLVMREPERAMLADMGDGPLIDAESNAAMNATFIRVDGNGTDVRYNVSVRNRGGASRVGPPNNYRVNFPHDRPWNGVVSINLNSRFIHAQIMGSVIYRLAGLAAAEASAVQVRVNGEDLSEPAGPLMFGSYAQLENITGSFPDRYFPDDRRGNLYRAVVVGADTADLSYRGPDQDAYKDIYSKRTNEEQDDWSDLVRLTHALNEAPENEFVERISEVIDLEQWLRYIALDSLLGNRETGLALGTGDNYWLYRGAIDTRFRIIPHDLDTILGRARVGEPNRSIFAYTSVPGLRRLLTHPDTVPRYYQAFLDLIEEVYNPDTLHPLMDQVLGRFVPQDELDEMKQFVVDRIQGVMRQLPREFTVTTELPTVNGIHRTTLPAAEIVGTADALRTKVVRVNGEQAEWSPFTREWSVRTTSAGEARTLIDFGAEWKYFDDGSNLANAWQQVDLDDTEWPAGRAPLGYGNGDEATTVSFGSNPNDKHVTTYFRHSFDLLDRNEVRDLTLRLERDDGAIVYLNGSEIVRSNMPTGGVDFQTVAATWIGGGLENQIHSFSVDPSLLVDGKNVMAVEIHQRSPIDDDIRLDLSLEATVGAIEGGVRLLPGLNQIEVETYDEKAATEPFARKYMDVWYDGAIGKDSATCESYLVYGQLLTSTVENGELTNDSVMAPCGPAYRVNGNVVVPDGVTLTILPGTSIFFEADARITVDGGRLVADGSKFEPIRFTKNPASNSAWNGIHFRGAMTDNRIAHAIIEHAVTADGMVAVQSSELTVDSVTFRNTDQFRIRTVDSSLVVRNSKFDDIFPENQPPTTDNRSEHIWGSGIAESGRLLIEQNYFGTTKGHNDAIDFDGAALPNAIPIIRNNYFAGSGDDAVDLESDAIIEGNTFVNIVKDEFNSSTGDANAISAGAGRNYFVFRNVFSNVDHAAQVKDDAFMRFENNTVSGTNISAIYFDLPDRTPGRGAIVRNSIFDQTVRTIGAAEQAEILEVHHSIVGPDAVQLGQANLVADPRFNDAAQLDFDLRKSSPAIGAGSSGIDLGAKVADRLVIAGLPEVITSQSDLTLNVYGPGFKAYRYRLNGGAWSDDREAVDTLVLTDLASGRYTIEFVGKNVIGEWQSDASATVATWTIAPDATGVRINEVLADNIAAFEGGGEFPDAIELYNTSSQAVDVSRFSVSDDINRPQRFVFAPGTVIEPHGYVVLTADQSNSPFSTDFGLDADGEGVFLFGAQGELLDALEFGVQIADYSIGRTGRNAEWTLSRPTLGFQNEEQISGDVDSLRINEWFASPAVRYNDDFIELHNSDTLPVQLSGLHISDDSITRSNERQIPPLSFIAASGFTVFRADGNVQRGADHVAFQLNESGEIIELRKPSGELIDQVIFFEQTDDWSEGRSPDGASTITSQKVATPGLPNIVTQSSTHSLLDWDAIWSYDQSQFDWQGEWMQPTFDDSPWMTGQGVFALRPSELPEEVRTDLADGILTSYFRSTFDVPPELFDSSAVTTISAHVLVDDGAAVYVNGMEMFRIGLPDGEITVDTRANRGVSNAVIEGPFAIPLTSLRPGGNVIAVELHQISSASADAVFGLSLEARTAIVDAEARRAEQLVDGLRITELMYHPQGNESTEFIELANTSNEALRLDGVEFRGGIDFVFADQTLQPGERVVVVRDREQFENAYGLNVNIAGVYAGNLSNRSDRIRLLLPHPFDGAILDFTYHDDWSLGTDGEGRSLVISDVGSAPRDWQSARNWRPSYVDGGSPGFAEPHVSPDFDGNGRVTDSDVDVLCQAIRSSAFDAAFDLNGDTAVDHDDLAVLIQDVLRTSPGDVNLDGRFNSSDLVAVFQGAQYDDDLVGNSRWSTGDWNCDGEFDSSDLVIAFQTGRYSHSSKPQWNDIGAAILFDQDDDHRRG